MCLSPAAKCLHMCIQSVLCAALLKRAQTAVQELSTSLLAFVLLMCVIHCLLLIKYQYFTCIKCITARIMADQLLLNVYVFQINDKLLFSTLFPCFSINVPIQNPKTEAYTEKMNFVLLLNASCRHI